MGESLKQLLKEKSVSIPLAICLLVLVVNLPTLTITTSAKTLVLITLQLLSVGFVIRAYLTAVSQSSKLFWQFFIYALLSAFLMNFIVNVDSQIVERLKLDFLYLFIFFFLFLAIENNPHLGESPLHRYISGRLPALLYCVFLFAYLVLIPAHYNEQSYLSGMHSMLFTIIASALMIVRLVEGSLLAQKQWKKILAMLAFGGTFVLIESYLRLNVQSINPYLLIVTETVPYLAIILAAHCATINKNELIVEGKEHQPVFFTLLLTLVMLTLYISSQTQPVFYAIDTYHQPTLLATWFLITCAFIFYLANKNRKQVEKLVNALKLSSSYKTQLEDELNTTNQKLINSEEKAIVSVANSAILTTTTDGIIRSANSAAIHMFQCLEEDLIDQHVKHLFAEDDDMRFFFNFKSNLHSLERNIHGISVECTSVRKDGFTFPVQAELQWADRDSYPLIVLTFINLTERKRLEQENLELKDQFIANISHEFRTPLTIINGILDRNLTNTISEQEASDLTTAKKNGLRLIKMVEQLLELSKLSDSPKLSLQRYRLHTLMNLPLASFHRLASNNHLTFQSNIPDDLWLDCDAQAFEKIIFNLISNAIKYTGQNGTITVNASQTDDSIILDVIDTGIGISADEQDKIFDRFQRSSHEKTKSTFGVGIGLSLVNELVNAHLWRINLTSELGRGSKFSIVLPKADAIEVEKSPDIAINDNELETLLLDRKAALAEQSVQANKVVLIIEDNLDMQHHIKQVVERNYQCLLASSGEQGVLLANEYMPDLIVCDLMLTGIDGFEVLQQIRNDELTANIPLILLTARSDIDSRLHGLKLNADEYLSKPFNEAELIIRIENLINNREQLRLQFVKQYQEQQKLQRKEDCRDNAKKLSQDNKEPSLSSDEKFLTKLESFLAEHYADQGLDITSMANHLAMSDRQLQRKIKLLLNVTPNTFLKEFRLEKAKELLLSDAQIGLIALDVGFSSQTYFGKCFKEHFGCTPKQFRQENKSG